MAETAIATGKRKLRNTPVEAPSPARMNENSPIWARLIPAWMESRTPLPATKDPMPTPRTLPVTTTATKISTDAAWSRMATGSISMPIETKNTPAKMSRIGRTRRSASLASPDSATSAPARNAPKATE